MKKQHNVSLNSQIYREAKIKCLEKGISFSSLIDDLLRVYVGKIKYRAIAGQEADEEKIKQLTEYLKKIGIVYDDLIAEHTKVNKYITGYELKHLIEREGNGYVAEVDIVHAIENLGFTTHTGNHGFRYFDFTTEHIAILKGIPYYER